jgi:hypothetical protein
MNINLKDTYTRIKRNEYHIPSRVSLPAKNLITRLLKADPTDRPTVEAILQDEFFSSGKCTCNLIRLVKQLGLCTWSKRPPGWANVYIIPGPGLQIEGVFYTCQKRIEDAFLQEKCCFGVCFFVKMTHNILTLAEFLQYT